MVEWPRFSRRCGTVRLSDLRLRRGHGRVPSCPVDQHVMILSLRSRRRCRAPSHGLGRTADDVSAAVVPGAGVWLRRPHSLPVSFPVWSAAYQRAATAPNMVGASPALQRMRARRFSDTEERQRCGRAARFIARYVTQGACLMSTVSP